ncbi:MAG: hypothetical protein GF335_01655 [Candidatus Moranbacteria bacterium]|nr:hypothetical protein [Candidatus Moranbacteria bacterium]
MPESLEYLFGSKKKLRLIKTFILNADIPFTSKEISQRIKFPCKSVSSELLKMEKTGFIKSKKRKNRKFYFLNKNYIFYADLKNIVAKCNITPQSKTLNSIKKCGDIVCAVLTGIFVDDKKSMVDLFIAGERLSKNRISKLIGDIEADIGREIRYSVMGSEELIYRSEMLDKFVTDILDEDNIILVNRIREKRKKYRKSLKNVYR